jgi:hypothetical protein
MPIAIFITEDIITHATAQKLHREIGEIFLAQHNLTDNSFMTPNIIGEVIFVPKGLSFAGLKPADMAIVELRMPSFALESKEQKEAFVTQTTNAVKNAVGDALPIENIWVNAVYAVDGIWGIAGKTYTNEQLIHAISQA